jgi:hypothetical protein
MASLVCVAFGGRSQRAKTKPRGVEGVRVAGATWRASERARPASFPTLRRRVARDAAGAAPLARCVAPFRVIRLRHVSAPVAHASEVSAPYGCACGCALPASTRAHAALARCTSAARGGASESWLHGALRRVQSTQPCCSVSLQGARRARFSALSRGARRARRVCGGCRGGGERRRVGCAAARRAGWRRAKRRKEGCSEVDSRARCRRLFRLFAGARDVCRCVLRAGRVPRAKRRGAERRNVW